MYDTLLRYYTHIQLTKIALCHKSYNFLIEIDEFDRGSLVISAVYIVLLIILNPFFIQLGLLDM